MGCGQFLMNFLPSTQVAAVNSHPAPLCHPERSQDPVCGSRVLPAPLPEPEMFVSDCLRLCSHGTISVPLRPAFSGS